ncbi:MAG: FixH family protein [Pseudomonadota bacterium]
MTQIDLYAAQSDDEKKLKGWHVLLIMLAFFGVMFAVNGVFLYHAITSFPGEDVKKSYVQGLNYNQTLDQRMAQSALGWSAEAGLEGETFIFRLSDDEGEALSNYAVFGELRRLATQDEDTALIFDAGLNGEYSASTAALSPGQWQARINVLDRDAETLLFQANKTIRVP